MFLFSLRAVNLKYIAIEWMKPRTFGDAAVSAYKVYVNGVVEATLGADQLSFCFSNGVACHEYVFQVQVSPYLLSLHIIMMTICVLLPFVFILSRMILS